MGVVSDSSGDTSPLVIGRERRATISDGMVHLKLELSARPDALWLSGFARRRASSDLDGVVEPAHPWIDNATIRWSVRPPALTLAWQYICRCVDQGNAATARVPAQRRGGTAAHPNGGEHHDPR